MPNVWFYHYTHLIYLYDIFISVQRRCKWHAFVNCFRMAFRSLSFLCYALISHTYKRHVIKFKRTKKNSSFHSRFWILSLCTFFSGWCFTVCKSNQLYLRWNKTRQKNYTILNWSEMIHMVLTRNCLILAQITSNFYMFSFACVYFKYRGIHREWIATLLIVNAGNSFA